MTECEKECIISIAAVKEEFKGDKLDRSDCEETVAFENKEDVSVEHRETSSQSAPGSAKSNECSVDERIKEIDQAIQHEEEEEYVDPIDLYRKLEIIKEIKSKTLYLQRIKSKIAQDVDSIEYESKSLLEFKSELELLVQEEKSHLEELRQIQNDIQMMENTIKQTNEEKFRAIESARRLNCEYKPLKDHINHLRDSIGLDRTDDNDDEILIDSFIKKLAPIGEKSKSSYHGQHKSNKSNSENSHRHSRSNKNPAPKESIANTVTRDPIESKSTPTKQANQQHPVEFPVQLATAALMAQSLRSLSPNTLSQHQQHFQHQFNPFILNQVNLNNEKSNHLYQQQQQNQQQQQQQQQQLQSLPPPFRQQPPPMKTCLSCNQQIHRNAPICPLCKAKSRSINPKKPKKKAAEGNA